MKLHIKRTTLDIRGMDATGAPKRKGVVPKVKKPSIAKMKRLYDLRKVVPC